MRLIPVIGQAKTCLLQNLMGKLTFLLNPEDSRISSTIYALLNIGDYKFNECFY